MEPSATTIESDLRKLRELPTPVAAWQVETGPDATEYPSVWVDMATRSLLREMVRDTVRQRDGKLWVYVRFRGASETV